jgi:hypothetical protein
MVMMVSIAEMAFEIESDRPNFALLGVCQGSAQECCAGCAGLEKSNLIIVLRYVSCACNRFGNFHTCCITTSFLVLVRVPAMENISL